MASHRMPVSSSPKEISFDEWERITQDPVKRVAFDRKCIEHELTDEKRIILLQENPSSSSHCRFWDCYPSKLYGKPNIRSAFRFNVKDLSGRYYEPNKYYHVSCMEKIFPDLSALVERGALQMEGGITQLSLVCWQTSRFHNAIEDWFRYEGHTFEVSMYDRFKRAHDEWEREYSTVEIDHQLGSHEGSSQDCEKCEEVPEEPQRKDYFPEEPCSRLLSEVLASVIRVGNLDFRV